MKRGLFLLGVAIAMGGCSTVPSYQPVPIQLANGRLGFAVSGIASFTRDRQVAEVDIRQVLEKACAGPIELQSLTFQDASSAAGIPHLAYAAEAECRT